MAVPADRDTPCVRRFGCFTEDLHGLADWLVHCGIDTVAMESTGVYWVPLFQVLERRGFQVYLVNARHVKNVPGRKTDVQDCQWLQQLHSFGLLAPSFRPEDTICVLRSYWHHRDNLVRYAASHVQYMQKALEQLRGNGARRDLRRSGGNQPVPPRTMFWPDAADWQAASITRIAVRPREAGEWFRDTPRTVSIRLVAGARSG